MYPEYRKKLAAMHEGRHPVDGREDRRANK